MTPSARAIGLALRTRAPLPLRSMLIAGGAVGAISTIAFFRVSLLPPIGADLKLTPVTLSMITTVFAAARLVTDVPAGRLADRAQPTRSLMLAAIGVGFGSLVLALSGSLGTVLAASAVLGVASAIGNTTGMTFFSSRATIDRRGTSMAVFSAALLVGQALGPTIAGLLTGLGSWHTAAAVGAAAGAVVVLLLLAMPALPGITPYVSGGDGGNTGAAGVSASVETSAPLSTIERVVLYGVSFASFFALGAMPQTLVPLIGADVFGYSVAAIGLALGLGGICRLVGSVVGGVVSDRVSRKAALVPGMAVMSVGAALLAIESWRGAWIIAIVLLSLGSFGMSVAATMLADRTHAAAVGRRFGSFRLAGDVGLMSGPLLTGLVYSHVGHAAAALGVAGLVVAFALASALIVRERSGRAEASIVR